MQSMNEPVRCFSHESAVYVIVPSGPTVVFDGSQRSSLLVHMACAEGPFSLPVSQRGLKLLKEAEASMEKGTSWGCRRFSDLGRVAEVSAFLDDEACHAWSVSQLARQLEQLVHSYLLQQLPTSRSRHTPQHQQEHKNQLTQGASRNSSQCEDALLSTCSWNTNQSHTVCHDGLHAVHSLPRGRNHHCNCLEFLECHASREHRLAHRQLGESACTHLDPRAACACKDLPSADSNVADKTFGDLACGSVESDSCSWLWSQAGLCIGREDVGSHGVCLHRVCQELSRLPRCVQLATFTEVQLPLCSLMHALPPHLHEVLFLRHFHPGSASLDMSGQLHAYTRDGVQRCRGGLHALSSHLAALCPLRHIDISHNSLCDADGPLIATVLNKHACELQSLRLACNFSSDAQMHASALNCGDSDSNLLNSSARNSRALQQTMACIVRCAVLTILDLSGCTMNSACMRALGATLHGLPALQRLDLNDLVSEASNGSFSTGSFRPVCAALPELMHLSHLSLCNNDLTTHFQPLARAIRDMHALQLIDVGGNSPDLHSLACFIAAAAQAPQLYALNLDRLAVSCSSEWFFTLQLLQQCAAAFFEVVGMPLPPPSVHPDAFQPKVTSLASPDAYPGTHNEAHHAPAPAPTTPPLTSGAAQALSSGGPDRSRGQRPKHACPAPFKSLSLQSLTIEGVAVSSLLNVCVIDLAWSSHSSMYVPELQEATTATLAHAWRLTDALQGLVTLDLTGTNFEGFWGAAQSDFIANLRSLRDLRMARCSLPCTALASVCVALANTQPGGTAQCAGVTALDWRENPVSSGAIEPLCSLTTLQSLRLQGCGLSRRLQAELRMHAARVGVLTQLDLGFSREEAGVMGGAAAA